jgi:hypothetical protein
MRAAALIVLVTLALAAAASASAVRPRLAVTDEHPFTVRGSSFEPSEHVRLTVYAGNRFVRSVVATAHGTFVVRFRTARGDSCTGYAVSAVGNKGSRASLKLVRECPPPAEP